MTLRFGLDFGEKKKTTTTKGGLMKKLLYPFLILAMLFVLSPVETVQADESPECERIIEAKVDAEMGCDPEEDNTHFIINQVAHECWCPTTITVQWPEGPDT